MKNITQSGYETITVVRSQYDPVIGQCLTISPVLWIKESKDKDIEDQKYFVFARNGCIRDIFDIKDPIPLEILTECGYVKADENGQIQVEGTCGIRAVSDDCPDFCINLLTGYGLKGGGQICKGETRTIELDSDITGDVRGPDGANVGDVPVFGSTDGKSITTSNINSVDGLTKITKSSKGEQKLLVETADTESGSNAGIEAKSTGSGTPYFQLTQGDQKWRTIVNPETGAREIRPVDDLSKGSILSMLPNGVMLMPWQPKMAATFNGEATIGQANVDVDIGGFGGVAFTKILDQDGYNLSANNFYPGDGSGQGAYYTTTYENGLYLVIVQFLINKPNSQDTATVNISIKYPGIEPYRYRKELLPNVPFETFTGMTVIKGVKGNKINFSVATTNNTLKITNLGGASRENYIGIYMLG